VAEKTKHYIEAYIEYDSVSSRLVCEDPEHCTESSDEYREQVRGEIRREVKYARDLCMIVESYRDIGAELLSYPKGITPVFGRVEVKPEWEGYAEEAELYLRPTKEQRDAAG
jgi:hypothetical protein